MKEEGNPCPYDKANWLSRLTFWWLTPLFITGFKRPLTSSDIYDVSKEDNSAQLEKILERSWKRELRRYSDGKGTSLLRAVLRAFRLHWLLPSGLLFISELSKVLAPFLVGQLVGFFTPGSEVTMTTAYIYAVSLGFVGLMQMLNPLYYFIMQKTALKMKTAVGNLIYRKVLSLSSQSFYQTTSGQIVNLLSTDIEKFNTAIENIHFLWLSPLVMVTCIYLIYKQCGLASLFGFAVIILFMPLQMINAKLFGYLRSKIGQCSDRRVHMMTEIIAGIKVIKMYCWEQPFSKLINALRGREVRFLRHSLFLMAINMANASSLPRLMILVTFLGNWFFFYKPLGTADVFVTVGLLEILRVSLFFAIPYTIQTWTELRASTERVKQFLLLDEDRDLAPRMVHKSVILKDGLPHCDWSVEIDHMTARWEISLPEVVKRKRQRDSTSDTSRLLHESELEHYFSLKNITITVKKGELLAIIGTVGSGKSSLLLTLLGELPHQQGQITLLGKVGYYAQQAWMFSGTVRENVLFGGDMDEARYTAILEACALNRDIESMINGDLTLVGERGYMLSGGQKARLSLARTLYRNAAIYLLDDPLSAVDTKVGKHIFNKCILQNLAGKTRILVTHQLQYLQKVDRIVVLREGSLYDIGTFSELMSRGVDIATFLKTEDEPAEETDTNIDVDDMLLLSSTAEEQAAEYSETGTVGISVYLQYFKAGYGYILSPIVFIFVIGQRSFMVAGDWMLAKWAESMQRTPSELQTNTTVLPGASNISGFYLDGLHRSNVSASSDVKDWAHMPEPLQYFVMFVCGFVVCAAVFSVTHYQLCAFASQRLHDKMFQFVLGAKAQFFDSNPIGIILNRFSRDLGFVDDPMTRCLYVVIDYTVLMTATTVVVCVISPWLLIAVIPIASFVIFIRCFAIRTTRQIRRLEAVSRSPVYSHVSETIGGLQTIRAFGKEGQFTESFAGYQNHHASTWFLYLASYRWFSVRSLFAVIIFYNIIIQVCLALHSSISSGLLAMILIYSSAWMEPFEFIMRMTAELENFMTSVQRILSYSQLEQEKPKRSDKPPPPDWPMRGSITFTDVSLQYTNNTPCALKHINFHIKSKEKIGVVGRTGAGKSSLLAALFRLAEPTGKIWIDGLDVTKIGLHELREKLSIIPQDPTLFSGTLRKNLDPFDDYKDEDIWYALEQVQLKQLIERAPGKLYMEVSESGHNFSVGQRQLICLARAVLRYNKILILDEATANVDHKTDEFIQMTLRSKFRSCTVLTIAHRLNTVMDCDRIMVLDSGELKEFDIPFNLLQIQDGYFTQLVEQTGSQQAAHLRMLAQIAFGQRASASLLLEEAVKTATLHLRNSRNDLSKSRESLKSSQELVKKSLDSLNSAELAKSLDSADSLDYADSLDSADRCSSQNARYSDQRRRKGGVDVPETDGNSRMHKRPKFRVSDPAENATPPKHNTTIDKSAKPQAVGREEKLLSAVDGDIRKNTKTNTLVRGENSDSASAAVGVECVSPVADEDHRTPAASSREISPTEPLLAGDPAQESNGRKEHLDESSDKLLPKKHPYSPSPLARDQMYLKRISGGPMGKGSRFITGGYKPPARSENDTSDEDPQKIVYC